MTMAGVFVMATKLASLLVAASIAANAFSFSRFRRRNLMPFDSPIDESAEVLADFNSLGEVEFFFGLATAPAHAEDKLDDAWLQFAMEKPCGDTEGGHKACEADVMMGATTDYGDYHKASMPSNELSTSMSNKKKTSKLSMEAMITGFEKYVNVENESRTNAECNHNIAAWHNVPHPEDRLKFWSDPDIELKLAKDTGISVFRMGIDWARVMPKEPNTGLQESVNFAAIERYRWIVKRVRFYGMKVMVTLFHHSLPPWAGEYGGWKAEKTVDYFMDFTRLVVDRLIDLVDYWITFNEPHVFAMLTYCAGAWPGGNPDMLEVATSALPTGVFNQAMKLMSFAHIRAYEYIHATSTSMPNEKVGIAHHVSFMRPYGLFDVAAVRLAMSMTMFPFVDSVCEKLDFVGINYYGQEVVSGQGLMLVDTDEYSESGRGVYPDGLYRILLLFHERYKHLKMPIIITENGVSDASDLIRRPYLLEHLLAVFAAAKMGVHVLGYLFWTTCDNWEWADGYGPKFGLVEVDRENGLARNPRPSYKLFRQVVKNRKITKLDRALAWKQLMQAANENKTRPFYRVVDKHGHMSAGGLDIPTWRPYLSRDWRFGHYEMEGLRDPLSCLWRSILTLFTQREDKKEQADAEIVLDPLIS